jgi:cobalamin biosynthesis protein CobD/CbiB
VKVIGLMLGIAVGFGMLIGFIPLIGWFNWLNIPFAIIGLIINIIALAVTRKDEPKVVQISGIILCIASIFFGLIRLILGAGVV